MLVHRGVFPGYARIAGDRPLLKRAYLAVTAVLILVTLPAGVGLCLVAQPVVAIFLGNKWLAVVPLLQILAVNGALSVNASTAAYVNLAVGKPRLTALFTGVRAAVFVALMLWLVPLWGAEGAACAMLAAGIVTAPMNFRTMAAAVGLTLRDAWSIAWRPLAAVLVMSTAVLLAGSGGTPAETLAGNLANLMTAAVVGAAAYCGTVMLLWQLASRPVGAETYLLERLNGLTVAAGAWVGTWWK
jgi:O-antigen/teichoic acid export membrane protein